MSQQRVEVVVVIALLVMLIELAWSSDGAQPYYWMDATAAAAAPAPSQPVQPQCNKVVQQLTPCLQYVRGKEPKPSKACCDGAKQLSESSKSKPDRQAACNCIKQAIGGLPDIDTSRISSVPKECGIKFDMPPIDRNFDCSTIKVM
ncbi:probable non-specific lipid-transfer protein 2 [Humulus lupulus]|uniref:probable non-specific lipid-transfer protein 2 n=1 Tax=Humulus lupulus TaxID=3486 RepID=UPI002B40F8C8|nr:probable non-specific lipid-transfer protein 2 [Humulus lupulus]